MGNVKTLVFLLLGCLLAASAQNCGRQAGGRRCAGGLCCSQYGFCGITYEYCGPGCQSNCRPVSFSSARVGSGDLSSLIPQPTFEQMLKHRNDASCSAKDFYTYDAFITAAKAFDGFATVGDTDTRKREVAAFFAQSSQETAGGSSSAADGPYAWGYCSLPEQEQGDHPESVSTDATIAFKTALRFWMTPQSSKPSCHDVITGKWTPSDSDKAANRLPGFGVITNIMKGGVECSKGYNDKVAARIGFYKRYCDILGVSYGDNLDCYQQKPFA